MGYFQRKEVVAKSAEGKEAMVLNLKKKGGFKMKKRVLVTIVGVILLGSFLVIGLAAPVQAVTKWKYQSMWVPSITLWRGDKYFGDLMNILAAGELEIKYFPGGTLVKTSNEIFDAVVAGTCVKHVVTGQKIGPVVPGGTGECVVEKSAENVRGNGERHVPTFR